MLILLYFVLGFKKNHTMHYKIHTIIYKNEVLLKTDYEIPKFNSPEFLIYYNYIKKKKKKST